MFVEMLDDVVTGCNSISVGYLQSYGCLKCMNIWEANAAV